jgi:hypothetical protein
LATPPGSCTGVGVHHFSFGNKKGFPGAAMSSSLTAT